MRTLERSELTAALAARQLLLRRERLAPAEAIRRLTPLQGQEPQAPFIALAARLDGFTRAGLEAAIDAREVVRTTLMRRTLHLAAGADFPAYAQLARQPWLRTWRGRHPGLDEEQVTAELGAWLDEPRTADDIRKRVRRYDGASEEPWAPIVFARTLLPLVQLPPAGHWAARGRPSFVVDRRPLPDPDDAAALVLARYLEAFGPASRRDLARWAGTAQRDFAGALERVTTVRLRDERGTELLDLPGRPLPPASTPLPARFLARWDQALLAHADRERLMSPEVQALGLGLSGDQTVTVDGRIVASWKLERARRTTKLTVLPHVEVRRSAHDEVREEARRTARFCAPEAGQVEVAGLPAA